MNRKGTSSRVKVLVGYYRSNVRVESIEISEFAFFQDFQVFMGVQRIVHRAFCYEILYGRKAFFFFGFSKEDEVIRPPWFWGDADSKSLSTFIG